MATKLGKRVFPTGAAPSDFECFGPPATKDGEFDNVKIADLGCFKQDGTDSNKFYHGAVVKNKSTGVWYAYFEWGRTGAARPDFMFIECGSEGEAQKEFAKQLHSKNDKRGMWTTIAGVKTLTAKPNKDCYLVRPQATRSTGLPDAKSIKTDDGMKNKPVKKTTKKASKKTSNVDRQTLKLLNDMNVATVNYAKSSMATGDSIPTQTVIDEARQILSEAQKRIVKLGDSEEKQIKDKQMRDMSSLIYSRIPKIKRVGAPESEWILSQGNILLWQQDLDAFESALYTEDMSIETTSDPLGGLNVNMEWIDPKSKLGEFIHSWMPKATRNRHGYLGSMKMKNAWSIERHGVMSRFNKKVANILKDNPKFTERPICQPVSRKDLSTDDRKKYKDANVGLLFHGTRSVNVTGIMREGLRLPKQLVGVMITGAMFGGGHYWADDWKKSAGYCSLRNSYWAGGSGNVRGRGAFMFVADVALGSPHVAPGPRGYTGPPRGYHCVFGKAGKSSVQNNEWITFDNNQNQLRYLVEFEC